jgi:integrase
MKKLKPGPVAKIREGNVAIPIYRRSGGRYLIQYRELGETKPTQRPYKDLTKAKRVARETAIRLANGQLPVTAAQREQILHIEKVVAPFNASPIAAIEEWATYRRSAAVARRASVADVHAQLMLSKRDHKLSDRYMRLLRDDVGAFALAHPVNIDEVRAQQVEAYLRELNVGDRRRNNIRDGIVTLFLYAKEHGGYLPADKIAEAEKVKRIDLDRDAPEIYTPAQVGIILELVSPDWLDWICCQAFLGVRPEEAGKKHLSRRDGSVRKLMWSDFMWEERQLRIVAAISKTKRDRYVTLNDTFLAWCGHHHGETGPVARHHRPDRETGRLGPLLGFPWINDGLRHSYASYWQSIHKDMARLKEEMGNSEQVNRRYYYHPQPAAIAKKYWQNLPEAYAQGKIAQVALGLQFG